MEKAEIFKKTIDALKDFIKEAVFDVTAEGLSLQSMDASHVSLVHIRLGCEGFEIFRVDKNLALGGQLFFGKLLYVFSEHGYLAEIDEMLCQRRHPHLKGGGRWRRDDHGLRKQGNVDTTFVFFTCYFQNRDKISEYEMKLMDLDIEQLGIPDQDYR